MIEYFYHKVLLPARELGTDRKQVPITHIKSDYVLGTVDGETWTINPKRVA